ncbi:V-type proton ATPase subunit S1-like protein [Dissostichus eleginoides]|uniref:V-type proton ATPase subunit S1-like protein n=1 Tax=Dissostichus eleginoides TaxID=100907 RepID=A0AAD9B5S7_DISEL|nr:V-type proton ATPase subunit S1-like protein [Dissostichus eleginoides]
MMKISGRVTWCCVALLLALTSVSAVHRELNSITDLKKINFGQSVPKHSLLLLHWFANTVNIDDNNVISLTFDPNSGAYGSHHYGNFEGLLDTVPQGNQYRYYTIGSLSQDQSMQLPPYVARPSRQYEGENRDRIIVRVTEQNTGWQFFRRIDQVYITQHIANHAEYDPDHTYRITTNLLREIGEFSVGPNQLPLWYLRNRFGSSADDFDIETAWGQLACLGLLLYIVLGERHPFTPKSNYKLQVRQQSAYTPDNRQTSWCAALVKCCMIVVVLLIGLFILAISAARR